MSEIKVDEKKLDIITNDYMISELNQQLHIAQLLNSLEEVKLDLLEAKINIFEKDIEILDLRKQLLEQENLIIKKKKKRTRIVIDK